MNSTKTPTVVRKNPTINFPPRRNFRKPPAIRGVGTAKAVRRDAEAWEWELRLRRRVRTGFCWVVGLLGYLPILLYGTEPVIYASELLKLFGLVLATCAVFGLLGWTAIRGVLTLARRIRMRIPVARRGDFDCRIRTFAFASAVFGVIIASILSDQAALWLAAIVQIVFQIGIVVWIFRSGRWIDSHGAGNEGRHCTDPTQAEVFTTCGDWYGPYYHRYT